MRIIITGACGRMGRAVAALASQGYHGTQVVASVDVNCGVEGYTKISDFRGEADCIIDFSHHSATAEFLAYAKNNKMPIVIATTGHTPEELAAIEDASREIPIFRSANMSVGVSLLIRLAKTAVAAFPDADVEIVEAHHNRKLDVPSGTALMISEAISEVRTSSRALVGRRENGMRTKEEIGIHSVRMGNVVGEHEVIICTDTQRITLKHEAQSRELFAEGAIVAAEYLVKQGAGLYDMNGYLADK